MKQTEDLDKNNAELSRANLMQPLRQLETLATLGLNASKVAHEIANPLNCMFTYLQILERELTAKGVSRDRILDAIHYLCSEIAHLQTRLQELRTLGRPLRLNYMPVSLASAVAGVLHLSLRTAVAQALQIEKDFPEDLPPVMADPEKLEQVLMNLTKNAIEAMPEGGNLTLRGYKSGENVRLEIQDTGPGIPKEIKVFDPFVTSKPDGWGLGLCIAREIIMAHHGTIDYTSEIGHGTTFKISLPAAARNPRPLPLMIRNL